ncbi:MAG: 4-hydroxythreonine-4-phosphate dehydrogenase PdxA [Spirochaetota bacterium]|nr:4-hydroxythreonine-4-phosphate dehydrogenase PdxA [Spirochaetota bacterium]
MKRHNIRIGITIGDPAGIGPEVVLNALSSTYDADITPIVIGRYDVLCQFFPDLIYDYEVIECNDAASYIFSDKKYICNIPLDMPLPSPGSGNINSGIESKKYIDEAIKLWELGILDAIVTGPVNKGFISKSGIKFTGHTEYIAESIQQEEPYMMMFSNDYRVILITTHIPISKIREKIDVDKIYKTITIGYQAISSIDEGNIKLAITGLDPHCGDNGAISDFDINITKKAVEMALADNINIEGPFAADTLFLPAKWKSYNLVIAQYHDQGLIPFKTLTFDSGVNVTLGLSLIRTSVDHGTAYDIAGKGIAEYSSMREAIKLAYKLVLKRSKDDSLK